jgi:hypothetical protein
MPEMTVMYLRFVAILRYGVLPIANRPASAHYCDSTATPITQTHSFRSCGRIAEVYVTSRTACDIFPDEIFLSHSSDYLQDHTISTVFLIG